MLLLYLLVILSQVESSVKSLKISNFNFQVLSIRNNTIRYVIKLRLIVYIGTNTLRIIY